VTARLRIASHGGWRAARCSPSPREPAARDRGPWSGSSRRHRSRRLNRQGHLVVPVELCPVLHEGGPGGLRARPRLLRSRVCTSQRATPPRW